MTDFAFPELRMPTLEEHRETSAAWLKPLSPCLYENWPDALKALSFRTELLEITPDDMQAIFDVMDAKKSSGLDQLRDKLDRAIDAFGPCFIKLSSRSPKDWWPPEGPKPFRTGNDVLDVFCGSIRICDDLVQYKYADTPCYLLLREHHRIPPAEEWRCFIRQGRIVGISQYQYRDFFPCLVAERGRIAEEIKRFLVSAVIPALPIETVVADVWLKPSPVLIEINPYGKSDPCLFDYEELERASGELRIVEAPVGDSGD